jgi:hypothetical protein
MEVNMTTRKTLPHVFSLSALLLLLALTACGGGAAPSPTMDPVLIYTQAAQTVSAQFTLTAAAQPTSTPIPTEAPPTLAPAPTSAVVAPGGNQPLLLNTPLVLSSPTIALLPQATATGALCNNSAYVADVGVKDGTVLKPGQGFDKGWLLQNTGICDWTLGYYLKWIHGNTDFEAPLYVFRTLNSIVIPGQIAEVSLRMTAPKTPGKYEAFYQLYSNLDVPFGTGVSVSIEVKK